uniref:Uncharacterized protein LOC114336309 n=1 Tax=Diabrotica virgifera virgifera TaxID=50390 RepID=A0A6P7G0P2_DIAVI
MNASDVNKILTEVAKTREEVEFLIKSFKEEIDGLKRSIEATETRIILNVEGLNKKVKDLEKENLELKSKLEKVERKSKENSIFIYGLELSKAEISSKFICDSIKKLLGIDICFSDSNNFIWFKNYKNNPIKLELVSNTKKREILKNCHRLKGKNINITHDYTHKQREEQKILKYHLKLAREKSTTRSYIKGNKLFVDESSYSIEDLQDTGENLHQTNSEPNTPTIHKTFEAEIPVFEQKPIGTLKNQSKYIKSANIKKNIEKEVKNKLQRTSSKNQVILLGCVYIRC